MNADINLLRKDEETLRKQRKIKKFNFAAVISLAGVGITSLILFVLIQAVNPPSTKKEQDDILMKMSQFQGKEAKLLAANDRINNIQAIFEGRKNLQQTISALLTKIPGGLLIENMELNDKSVAISGSSTSLLVIGQFINNLTDMVRQKSIINSLTLNSLVFDENKNVYQISLKADF